MPATISTGKRGIIERELQAAVNKWSNVVRVPPPLVKLRQARRSRYNLTRQLITISIRCLSEARGDHPIPPALVHEFAHYIDDRHNNHAGHGLSFRVALVVAATVAYGRPKDYRWAREYRNVQKWAIKHGLQDAALGGGCGGGNGLPK